MSHFSTLPVIATAGAAVAAAGLPAATADAQALEGLNVTVDGGLAFSDFSQEFFRDKVAGLDVPTDEGFFGSIAISGRIADAWDWRVSATALGFGETTAVEEEDGSIGVELSATTIDATAGYNTAFGATNLRLGFGLVNTELDERLRFTLAKGVAFLVDAGYSGTGVILSADVAHPVSADGRTSLIGGLSVAPTSGEFSVSVPGEGADTIDGDALLTTAYVGLSFQQNENVALRLGLRLDRYDADDDGGVVFGIAGGDKTTTSAFVGLRVGF